MKCCCTSCVGKVDHIRHPGADMLILRQTHQWKTPRTWFFSNMLLLFWWWKLCQSKGWKQPFWTGLFLSDKDALLPNLEWWEELFELFPHLYYFVTFFCVISQQKKTQIFETLFQKKNIFLKKYLSQPRSSKFGVRVNYFVTKFSCLFQLMHTTEGTNSLYDTYTYHFHQHYSKYTPLKRNKINFSNSLSKNACWQVRAPLPTKFFGT